MNWAVIGVIMVLVFLAYKVLAGVVKLSAIVVLIGVPAILYALGYFG